MIKNGKAYVDNTPLEQMREERLKCIESACRNKTPEENMKIFEGIGRIAEDEGMNEPEEAKMKMCRMFFRWREEDENIWNRFVR